MINLAISLGAAIAITLIMFFGLGVTLWIDIPFGLMIGLVLFFWLGRKMQVIMENLQLQIQKDLQPPSPKFDRAIETLKQGYAYKHRHLFVESQLNSLIGTLYYLKKDHDNAMPYLQKGFFKNFLGDCMLACIYFKRKDYDAMKKTMDQTTSSNKKEPFAHALYAYFLYQLKDKEGAIAKLRKGLKKLPEDEKLLTNLSQLQNDKKMKMKIFGDAWTQLMLEKAPRMMQEPPKHMRMNRRAVFRGR